MSNPLTQRELRHTNRVVRLLDDAVKKMQSLSEAANSSQTFPNTTQRALIELMNVRSNTQIRIVARDAKAI